MEPKPCFLLCFALLALLASSSLALNITQILSKYPEFSSFNSFLTETKVADQINSRKTITVLVFENSVIDEISDMPVEIAKKIISTHVLLDFFDEKKLAEASSKSTLLTTLFQASGQAVNQQGFVSVSLVGEGEIAFRSAVKDSNVEAKLVKTVMSEPSTISVLQITQPIIATGIETSSSPAAPAPTTQGQTSSTVPKGESPKGSPKEAPKGSPKEAPKASPKEAPKASPKAAPKTSTPTDAPTSEAPVVSTRDSEADGSSAPAPAPGASGASHTRVGSGLLVAGVVMGLASTFVAL